MPASGREPGRIGLRHVKTYSGPNPCCDEPCVVVVLDVGPEAAELGPGRCDQLAEACRSWFDPPQTTGQSGERGEKVAAFLAAWALALLNRGGGLLHSAGAFLSDEQLHMYVGTHHGPLTLAALQLATELFEQADRVNPTAVEARVEDFCRSARQLHPDFQVQFLIEAARAAGIPYLPFFPGHRLWQFGWGRNGNVFFESEPKGDSAIGWKVARDKLATKAVFASLGVRMPPHMLARSEADLPAVARTIGWPCVVKPATSGLNKGVTADVDSLDKLTAAFRAARSLNKGYVFVERQVEGEVYRIALVRGEIAYVIRRLPPFVVGDGRRSVRDLVDAANEAGAERRAALGFLGPMPTDGETEAYLSRQGIGLDDVPAAGRKVALRTIPSMRQGAIYDDVTDIAHPDVCTLALMLAESLGLETCGIDFISRDIAQSCSEEGWVLEINTTPGLRQPLVAGWSVEDIGRQVLGDNVGRIPVTLVLASRSDLERLRQDLHFTGRSGWVVSGRSGLGTLSLSETGDEASAAAPPSLPKRVSRILRNPLAVDLTIVCTPEELAEGGIPIDRFSRVIACPVTLDPAWREVLAARADLWLDAQDAAAALIELQSEPG